MFREKIVAEASRRVVIVVDESKLSPALGTRHALPVEVAKFGWKSQERFLAGLGLNPAVRRTTQGGVYETDQGNAILDCATGPISDPKGLAAKLAARAGIVEHGLFCGIASEVIVAGESGSASSAGAASGGARSRRGSRLRPQRSWPTDTTAARTATEADFQNRTPNRAALRRETSV